jgi:hypothetical protein
MIVERTLISNLGGAGGLLSDRSLSVDMIDAFTGRSVSSNVLLTKLVSTHDRSNVPTLW